MYAKTLHRTTLIAVLILLSADVLAQKIENIRPEIIEDRIRVYYDLMGIAADQPVIVRIYLSTDGGKTYGEPLKSVTGDVGIVIGPGQDKRIIWNVFDEVEELVSDDVRFMVKADLLQSGSEGQSLVPVYALHLGAELGSRLELSSYGINLKFMVNLKRLGLGVRATYYRNSEHNADGGYYWGYSGGAIIDYDFLRNPKYSLYPFGFIGQTKILYVEEGLSNDPFAYSMFGSAGVGFSINIYKFIYAGLESEYRLSPWFDIDKGGAEPERIGLDGLSFGFVLKFVIHPN